MKTLRFFVLCACLLLLPLSSVSAGVDSYHESGTIAVDETIWNHCTFETVHLTGNLMWSSHEVITDSGTVQWGFQTRYKGVVGVGMTSGIKYLANSGEHGYGSTLIDSTLPYHYSAGWINTVRLISRGNAADFIVLTRVHVTVTPDFTYHVNIDDYEVICK